MKVVALGLRAGCSLISVPLLVWACGTPAPPPVDGATGSGNNGSGGASSSGACSSCTSSSCATEVSACNSSANCKKVRDCDSACAATDELCQANCVASAATDPTAVEAAETLLACVETSCETACTAPATVGAGGTSAAGGMGSLGTSGATSSKGGNSATGSSGATGSQGGNGAGGAAPNCPTTAPAGEVLLIPDATGVIVMASLGVQGGWYAYGDGVGVDGSSATGDCEMAGHAASTCAQINSPLSGSFPNNCGAMATSGTSEVVTSLAGDTDCALLSADCDYTAMWGSGIGISFNQPKGTTMPGPYSASAHQVLGVAFDLDTVPAAGLRVEFPTTTTGNTAHIYLPGTSANNYVSPVVSGHNRIMWADLVQPAYVTALVPFDPSTLLSVQFHVPTTTLSGGPYSFTISHFAFITG